MNKEKLRLLFEGCPDKYVAAKEFGSTYQSVYNLLYKDGTTCKVDLIERIAAYFNVPVGYFFNDEEMPSAVVSGNGNVAVDGNNNITNNVGANAAVLQERVSMLKRMLEEKERLIQVLLEGRK